MPRYTFECQECQVRFERNLRMEKHTTYKCPSCGELAPRLFAGEGISFAFAEGGSAAANSGVHGHDYPTADQVVGRSSAERWEVLNKRDQVKNEARKQGSTHALIRTGTDEYIDYEPMTPTGQDARRKLAHAALKAAREEKAKE